MLIGNRPQNDNDLEIDSNDAENTEDRPSLNVLLAPVIDPLVVGDFTFDDAVDATDLSILCGAIRAGADHPVYDTDGSGGPANVADLDAVLDSLGTLRGDANLDGRVDAADLNVVGQNWLAQSNQLGWGGGDFNCDGRVDPNDLNELGQNWLFGVARAPQAPLANVGQAAAGQVGAEKVNAGQALTDGAEILAHESDGATAERIR